MQVEIPDQLYREIEAVVGPTGGNVADYILVTLTGITRRMAARSDLLPAEFRDALDAIQAGAPSGSRSKAPGTDKRVAQEVDKLRSAFSAVGAQELQEWIDAAVEEVEADFRRRSLDARSA